MTDRDLMVERIQAALKALDDAHGVKETLKTDLNHETANHFREHMLKLADELEELKLILEHESEYSLDELAESLSQTLHGPHAYRRIPPVEFAERVK